MFDPKDAPKEDEVMKAPLFLNSTIIHLGENK